MIDKMIHQKEFRLRIMLTDACDRACDGCLNEFQPKGILHSGAKFIDPYKAMDLIKKYVRFCKNMRLQSVISFTGGEPGLHTDFSKIIDYTKTFKYLRIQVNTNGYVDSLDWNSEGVDVRYHIGLGLNNHIVKGQTVVYIIKEDCLVSDVIKFLTPFYLGGMSIKTFADFNASDRFHTVVYPDMLKAINKCFPVSGRFTGKQINRGDGCYNCEKKCITLKALWMFPDNRHSPCPQRERFFNKDVSTLSIFDAYNFHSV